MNEMIMRETDESQVLDYAKNIKNSGNSLLQLVNGILDFSKIEGGKMEIVPVKYSTETLVSYVINSIKERAAEKKLEFIANIDPELPKELNGDDVRLEQIILNLLSNAVKYTPSGSVTLTLKAAERKEDSILLYAEVADTGIGIKEEDMERLFESFERLDTVKNRNIEGTGLGMSITTKLLRLMDSELKVKSKYGEGSVFYFSVWQKIENPEPMGEYKSNSTSTDILHRYRESFRAPKAHILVVDDTRMNLTVVVNLLKTTGISIDIAENGDAALKLTEQNKYDVILLDQRMPGMDGVETLKTMRAQETNKNAATPVICLTADAIRGARDRYISEGFNDYLTKPVEGEALEKMLIEYLPEEKVEKTDGKKVSDNKIEPVEINLQVKDNTLTDEKAKELQKIDENTRDNRNKTIVGKVNDIANPAMETLKQSGIDVSSGLDYCMNDMEFYESILSDFANDYTDKVDKLNAYKKDKNWRNYNVQIHSVKSSARTIGAKELADRALELEKASADGNEAIIMQQHDAVMTLYKETVNSITGTVL